MIKNNDGYTEEQLVQFILNWEDNFGDMVTVHDKDFNIIKANKSAEKILGLSLSRIIETKCYRNYHGKDSPPAGCLSCNCLRTGKPVTFEIFEPHLHRHLGVTALPRFDSNNELIGLIHVVKDITDRKRNEEIIQLQIKHLNVLHSIEKAITSTLDLNIILDILIEKVITQLKIDAVAVLLLKQHTQILEYVVSRGFRTSALKHTKLKLGESNAGRAAIERNIVTISNLKEDLDGFIRSELFPQEEFISYIAVPLIAKGEVKGVLELFHRTPLNTAPGWVEFIETVADGAAIAIDNATVYKEVRRSNVELTHAYDTTIEGWSRAMDLRDKETEGHSQRVTEITVNIARKIGIKEELEHIKRGALLHDIGKMGIPDNILLKPGRLTDEEWKIMKKHPVYAYELLYPIEYLRPAIDIPYYHHEKWDGTGYPRGFKGKDIPLSARIFAIVDVWDALLSDRPYRPAWSKEKALEHIKSQAGTHFEPEVVDIFLKMEL